MNLNIPKTPGQEKYLKAIHGSKPILVATGPAGCGKTMFACQYAAEKIKTRESSKLILTRPIVAADEDLGYLPGDADSKMEPWARPMIDIFEEHLTRNQLAGYVKIEPLGFMRGRTFNNSIIIADEMQNATQNQMKMLITRIGENSKMIVMGDLNQTDLLDQKNGLIDLIERLGDDEYEYIDRVVLGDDDVLRSPAVSEILRIY
jgi:phosphate starvation-inducible PhoH-like protein